MSSISLNPEVESACKKINFRSSAPDFFLHLMLVME